MQCFVCKESFPEFITSPNEPRSYICPKCGSRSEHRFQFLFLSRAVKLKEGQKIMAVGCSEPELRYIAQHSAPARATAIDPRVRAYQSILKPPNRALQMDVTHLSFSDQSFDLVLCGDVLPYIRSDFLAMSEIHRCLKSDGLALITAKIFLPKSRRASELHGEEPEKFSRAFLEQNGDEWVYGADYFERLEAAGFFFHRLQASDWLDSDEREEQGIPGYLELILCFKFRDGKDKFLKEVGLG